MVSCGALSSLNPYDLFVGDLFSNLGAALLRAFKLFLVVSRNFLFLQVQTYKSRFTPLLSLAAFPSRFRPTPYTLSPSLNPLT